MVVEDLARWLGEQLDEDAAQALAALSELDGPELGADWQYDGRYVSTIREQTMVAVGSQDFMGPGVGKHIAAHDPARALREIAAKREILARYDELRAASKEAGLIGDVTEEYQDFLLRVLALPYADREGYREEWAP